MIKDKNIPSIYGIGYLGEGMYSRHNDLKAYERWRSILKRCYCKGDLERHPTYKECKVIKEWLNFQNFAKWFYDNYYEIDNEIMEIDKDILHKDNKIYSSDNCIFVPHRINNLFTKRDKLRGELPIGVYKKGLKYISMCKVYKNEKFVSMSMGTYITPLEAFNKYKDFKENYIKEIADSYKDKIPKILYDAMYSWKVEITD